MTFTPTQLPIYVDKRTPELLPIFENIKLPLTVAFPVEDGIYRLVAPLLEIIEEEHGLLDPAAFFINHGGSEVLFAYPYYDIIEEALFEGGPKKRVVVPRLMISPFFHAQSSRLKSLWGSKGIDELFKLCSKEESEWPAQMRRLDKFVDLKPNKDLVLESSWPDFGMEFSSWQSYSDYNWELLFHLPFSIAVQLSKNQHFEDSRRWFHYIFNPTDASNGPTPERYWRFRPFKEEGTGISIGLLLKKLADKKDQSKEKQDFISAIRQWRDNPFEPHVVARARPRSYMYSIAMRYVDNLITWADQLFRRETREALSEATQLYILAAQILGPRPEAIPRRTQPVVKAFSDLRPELSGDEGLLGNPLVTAENLIPSSNAISEGQATTLPLTLYFGVPPNPKILEYYTTIENRLSNLRNCRNIDGVSRPLAFYEPEIEPGLLVKARAAGIELSDILADINAPIPVYRFNVMAQKASELCMEVKALGSALLAAIEKRDSEALARLRSEHELQVLADVRRTRELQIEEARANIEALGPTLEAAQQRSNYYLGLLSQIEELAIPGGPAGPTISSIFEAATNSLGNTKSILQATTGLIDPIVTASMESLKRTMSRATEAISAMLPESEGSTTKVPMNDAEKLHLSELKIARDDQNSAANVREVARLYSMLPDITLGTSGVASPVVTAQLGGSLLSKMAELSAAQSDGSATEHTYRANLASILAGYQRRAADWLQQAQNAQYEIEQISKQIIAATLRATIAAEEIRNHDQQIENAQDVDDFMHSKYSNQELYNWMTQQVSSVYFRSYQLAYDVAKRAERAFQREVGVQNTNYIKFGYWDSLKKGLMAGENLYHDIKRMEVEYLEKNKREYEITKNVSIRQLDPLALLNLKVTGSCTFTVPEWLYDLDFRGHYMRRIKSVALSIPSVVGSYTSVNCTLSLLKSRIRKSFIANDGYEWKGAEDERFIDYIGAVESIVTSEAVNDSGMFETQLRDERYLHFEGAGAAESTWRLDMPKDYASFDHRTISDVILHIKYTARQGVDADKVKASLDEMFSEGNALAPSFMLLFNLHDDFPTEWAAFVNGTGNFSAVIDKNYFPYLVQNKNIAISQITGNLYDGSDLTQTDLINVQWDAEQKLPISASESTILTRDKDKEVFLLLTYSAIKESSS